MKLKVSDYISRKQNVSKLSADFGLTDETVFAYASAMSGYNMRREEFYTWCNQFFAWASAYSYARCQALKIQDKLQLTAENPDEFVVKTIKYGLVRDSREAPNGLVPFINYLQTHLDLFDTEAQRKFTKKYCQDLGLKVRDKDPDYWQQLAANINRYESGTFVKVRHNVSASVKGLVDRVANNAHAVADRMRESNPAMYAAHWLAYILPTSLSLYKSNDDVVTAHNFATRHAQSFTFPAGTSTKYVLVKQGEHFLVCTRAGKVLWDDVVDANTANGTLALALQEPDWVESRYNSAGKKHKWEFLDLGLDYPDDEEEEEPEVVDLQETTNSRYNIVERGGEAVIVTEDSSYAERMETGYPSNVRAYICNILGTSNEKDFDAFLTANAAQINSIKAEINLPLPTDKYALILAVLDTLI